ncbi:MAG TPA: AmmeMemoRadiSam system protein B [Planctomycetota bacterium]|nr:AmmeMemoRadiSam system protein B [Planctomycetota bacterium]OQC21459.1 MAG: hypothetical protein BWX69_00945 [Planctomycetes bacterium ADurb.Bin069]HNR97782.1 AmmeMemoRadiSam system protein B [Planctomycetota bacterium]HNU24751.1 AmmeMemoRadiSam system protein B [Planctomycetota bacterium]HOE29953.1 AmmeMemoRadiSam system protein B [Planctomycetota bacterium]
MRTMRLSACAVLCGWMGACAAPAAGKAVREPAVAGAFYPAGPEALRSAIEGCLRVQPDFGDLRPSALIAPHAGYVYSGKCAGAAYSLLRGMKFARVILLGPSHYGRFRGAALPDYAAFRTPLGVVPVDVEAVAALRAQAFFSFQGEADRREHSLEVQVPFLQAVLPPFKLLPILVGALDGGDAAQAAAALAPFAGEDALVVASSDFTHFGARFGFTPFTRDIEAGIRALDFGALAPILAGKQAAFSDYIARTGATVCGRDPIGVLLEIVARRPGSAGAPGVLLSYATSGEMTGARSDAALLSQGSVSYASVAFCRPGAVKGGGAVEPLDLLPRDRKIARESEKKLLALARGVIVRYLDGERHEDPGAYVDWAALPPEARFKAGAFVTLKKRGELRGCIGTIMPEEALWEAVVKNAINAAARDRRFAPVAKEEAGEISIEISVLTPPREVKSPEEFTVGRHGILMEKAGRRAIFLPQVAPEQGWNREQTLDHLAVKAGLAPEAWREGTRFWVFEAQVFGEDE